MTVNVLDTNTPENVAVIEINGLKQVIPYAALEETLPGFERSSVEWLTVQEEGNILFGLLARDGGKDTLVYGWNVREKKFVHVTKAPFTETLILDNGYLYILKNVFVLTEDLVGYLNLGKQEFGIIDLNSEPEKLEFYVEPEYREYYDENEFWISKIKGTVIAGCNDSSAEIEVG